jgi:hypothetical protein
VLSALCHIHSLGVVHRDVKAENILIAADGRAILADFGIAARLKDKEEMQRRCGTPGYAAPELLQGTRYGIKVDIFAAGVVLYLTLSGTLPFTGSDKVAIIRNTLDCLLSFEAIIFNQVNDVVKDLISKMLAEKASCRPSAAMAMTTIALSQKSCFRCFGAASEKETRSTGTGTERSTEDSVLTGDIELQKTDTRESFAHFGEEQAFIPELVLQASLNVKVKVGGAAVPLAPDTNRPAGSRCRRLHSLQRGGQKERPNPEVEEDEQERKSWRLAFRRRRTEGGPSSPRDLRNWSASLAPSPGQRERVSEATVSAGDLEEDRLTVDSFTTEEVRKTCRPSPPLHGRNPALQQQVQWRIPLPRLRRSLGKLAVAAQDEGEKPLRRVPRERVTEEWPAERHSHNFALLRHTAPDDHAYTGPLERTSYRPERLPPKSRHRWFVPAPGNEDRTSEEFFDEGRSSFESPTLGIQKVSRPEENGTAEVFHDERMSNKGRCFLKMPTPPEERYPGDSERMNSKGSSIRRFHKASTMQDGNWMAVDRPSEERISTGSQGSTSTDASNFRSRFFRAFRGRNGALSSRDSFTDERSLKEEYSGSPVADDP